MNPPVHVARNRKGVVVDFAPPLASNHSARSRAWGKMWCFSKRLGGSRCDGGMNRSGPPFQLGNTMTAPPGSFPAPPQFLRGPLPGAAGGGRAPGKRASSTSLGMSSQP